MKEYTFVIPDNLQAKELLNFILRSKIFRVKSSEDVKIRKKEKQKEMFVNDMKEAFSEIEEMKQGKKSKKTLKHFLDEF